MPRLMVFRGDALDREMPLVRLPIRIGRSPQNDLVLEDPVKSVSRDHAEIRQEGDRYILVDLESENGIWVAGQRVPTVFLDPNVVASIGPFRLKLEADGVSDTVAIIDSPPAAVARPTPVPGRTGDSGTAVPRPAVPPRPANRSLPLTRQQKQLIGGLAAVVAVTALVVVTVLFRPAPPPPDPLLAVAPIVADARLLIEQGSCAEALSRQIEPALARFPGQSELLDLKRRAEACLPPPPPTEPDPAAVVASALETARNLIDDGQCAEALDPYINQVLSTNPDHPEALEMKAQADRCVARRAAPATPTLQLAVRIPPAEGGLEPLPKEAAADYQSRVLAMRKRYDDAVNAAAKGALENAITLFEAIVREASPEYLDAATRLQSARQALRARAQRLLNEGKEFAAKELWLEAIRKFNEARESDPSLSVDSEIKAAEAGKLATGLALCADARKKINYPGSRDEAIEMYRRALTLVPAGDACYEMARKYVPETGR